MATNVNVFLALGAGLLSFNKEIAVATYNKDIFLSNDEGHSWTLIVDQGKGVNLHEK